MLILGLLTIFLSLQSTTMMENFMKLAKSNTDKNLETCGVLAGSLVSSDSLKALLFNLTIYSADDFINLHCIEKQKVLRYCSHYSEAGIYIRFGREISLYTNASSLYSFVNYMSVIII